MGELTREGLWKQLQHGSLAPVYVLSGPETFLRDKAAAAIIGAAFGPADLRDFNESNFSLFQKENIESALAAARQLPMMAGRRVVIVSDVRVASTASRDTLKEEYEASLAHYLAEPADTTVLIFVADELNGNRKLTKLLKNHSVFVDFQRLDAPLLVQWLKKTLPEIGCTADDNTLRYLVEIVGSDARRAMSELEKLTTAAKPSNVITIDLIDSLVRNSSEAENFALSRALVEGQGNRTLVLLKKELENGADPIMLLGGVAAVFHRLMMAKSLMESGESSEEVRRRMNLRGRDQEPILAAARRADMDGLISIFEDLRRADLSIKTSIGGGKDGPRLQLEMAVCSALRKMDRHSRSVRGPGPD